MQDKGMGIIMNIIVISSYAVIRDGIVSIISKYDSLSTKFVCENIKEAMLVIEENMDSVVLLDIHRDNDYELDFIKEMREAGKKLKALILDFYSDNELFMKAIRCGIQGYALGKSSEQEIVYAINQIYGGKKYFDPYFVELMVTDSNSIPAKIELLTSREKEILGGIAKGLSNRKIAEKFYITDHTVKKHINHIFEKLNIKDRTEAALYINKYGIKNI